MGGQCLSGRSLRTSMCSRDIRPSMAKSCPHEGRSGHPCPLATLVHPCTAHKYVPVQNNCQFSFNENIITFRTPKGKTIIILACITRGHSCGNAIGEVDLNKHEIDNINGSFKLLLIFALAFLIVVIFVGLLT